MAFLGLLAVSIAQDEEYPMSFLEQVIIVAIPAFLEGWWRSKHIKQEADEARLTQQMKEAEE
jgi:hypothetical protein